MENAADPPDAGRRPGRGRLKAAWALVVLAPLSAEATFSGVGMPVLWVILPLLVPMYGAGVLLIRELVARAGAGLPGLLLMGAAYELVEDGIGLQALTSPNLYNAAEWGPRVLGFNTAYWESQLGYHVVFSVLVPVALTDLLFPRFAGRPLLRRGGLIGAGVAAAVGVALLRLLIAGVEDPGYQAPLPVLAGLLLTVAVLAVLALRIVPRMRRVLPGAAPPAEAGRAPGLVAACLLPGAAALVFLGLLVPPGYPPTGPAVGGGWVVAAMAGAAAVAAATGWRIATWARTAGFTDIHRVAVIGGALVGHTLFLTLSALVFGERAGAVFPAVVGTAVIAATAGGLTWLALRLRRRAEAS
ncbi:hypothetical protein [Streptomonospora wellingtoniae]|uniref:Uncharacterized protein n=1 Tax=Streptomonospora wellingtoniae TaxID=3075544 RepID=A0ABU2L1B0_9ACTN|nr:hypothetical protein [Streptomonospora sp. DSM 45055]MDT0305167.1 hypothetical protein [Streptomonospora sp. DSM 45055]